MNDPRIRRVSPIMPPRAGLRARALLLGLMTVSFVFHPDVRAASSPALPLDPRVEHWTLKNGMRVWIRHNGTPRGQVELRLRVAAGSRADPLGLSGLAHLAEHLGFEGSARFPSGSLTSQFEAIGARFGDHQNARTSYAETVYTFSLPSSTTASLELGLAALADVAFGASDHEAALNIEKSVLLAELRDRESADLRIARQKLPRLFPGAALETHFGLGTAAGIARLRRPHVRRFRQTWYRPERSDLVIVGDVDRARLDEAIEAAFAPWPVASQATRELSPLPPSKTLAAAVFVEPEHTLSSFAWDVVEAPTAMRTQSDLRDELVDRLAELTFGVRMDQLRRQGELPVQSVYVWLRNTEHPARMSSISITMQSSRWKAAVSRLLDEWWRAVQGGFSALEIDGAKRSLLVDLRKASEANANSGDIANRLVRDVAESGTTVTERSRYEIAQVLLASVDADEVRQRFARRFGSRGLLSLIQPAREPAATAAALKALWQAARHKPVQPPPDDFPEAEIEKWLATEQQVAPEVERTHHAATGVSSAWLGNGVRLHVRSMNKEPGRVRIKAVFAGGRLVEDAATRGYTSLAAEAIASIETRTVTSSVFRRYLLGRPLFVGGGAWGDSIGISIEADASEVPRALRIANKVIAEGQLSPSDFDSAKTGLERQRAWQDTDVEAAVDASVVELLACGDVRALPLERAQLDARTQSEAQRWLDWHMVNAPVEVALVGDATDAQLLAWGRQAFGQLPRRPRIGAEAEALRQPRCATVANAKPSMRVSVPTSVERAAIEVGWRGPRYSEWERREALGLAADMLRSRLRDALRKKLGLVYDIDCFVGAATPLMSERRVAIRTTVAPAGEEDAVAAIDAAVREFLHQGPTAQEFEGARKQALRAVDEQAQNPAFWVSTLTTINFRGRSLDKIAEEAKRLQALTVSDVMTIAREHFVGANRYQAVATPARKVGAPNASGQRRD